MTLSADRIATFRQAVEGRVLEPGDVDYDEARRVWNGMVDKRPRLIIQASGRGRRRADHRPCP